MTKRMKSKRDNHSNDDGPHPDKRNRRNDDQVRVLIPSNIAGAIIGKGGQHIQKMRTQYKATVSVDDSQGPERTILISADLEATLQIITEMLKYYEERDDEYDVRLLIHQSLAGCIIGKGGQKIKEIRDNIGCRILKVFSNVAPQSTDRVVQTVGKKTQVVDAIREVITLTRETPIKGPIHNYDPLNYDRMYADEYGGYGNIPGSSRPSRDGRRGERGNYDRGRNDRSRSGGRRDNPFINPWANDDGGFNGGGNGFGGGNFGGSSGGFGGPGNFGGNNGGFGGPGGPMGGGNFGSGGFGNQGGMNNFGGGSGGFGGGPNGMGGGFGGPSGQGGFGGNMNSGGFGGPNNMVNGMGGNMGNTSGGGGSGGGSGAFGQGPTNNSPISGNLPEGHDPKNSTQVSIPKDLAGAIIGKGGGRIRRIRNESGAYITIDEPLPGSSDRIITISGNPKQIQMAQYLLQQRLVSNKA
ncbi:heterogeneous nuclear ribonucleoprotein K isoform X2 [Glossina fuscipes]|uniref:Heterogeneous nuclear ribonucleoprotein K isoform X2 n=2 Tax=Nemorhina TaxID=44051 RepID=A0A9C6DWS0_9MUSC|nr:heterogeneous nuclear ribonucleoprotein K isoform X2 [Glossina fuscipes]